MRTLDGEYGEERFPCKEKVNREGWLVSKSVRTVWLQATGSNLAKLVGEGRQGQIIKSKVLGRTGKGQVQDLGGKNK